MKEKRARRKYFVAAIKYVTWRRKQASDLNPDFQDQSLLAKNSDDKMWRKQDARHYIIRPQHNKCLGFVWRENAIETPVLHLQREKLAAAGSLRKQLFTSCIQDISFFKYIIRWSKKAFRKSDQHLSHKYARTESGACLQRWQIPAEVPPLRHLRQLLSP